MTPSESLAMEHVYRFAGFRAAVDQIECALNRHTAGDQAIDAIVVTGPRGVGVTTLLRHLTTFSGMGDAGVRSSWNPAEDSFQQSFEWGIRDAGPGSRLSQPAATITPTNVFDAAKSAEGILPLPSRHPARTVTIEMQPMTLDETAGYFEWCQVMNQSIARSHATNQTSLTKSASSAIQTLHDRFHGCIGEISRCVSRQSRRAA